MCEIFKILPTLMELHRSRVLLGRQICSFPMRSRGSVINIKCFLDL
ncbi:hypothetical protein Plhal304r1_c039g0115941 [Plasmopara halstedii]